MEWLLRKKKGKTQRVPTCLCLEEKRGRGLCGAGTPGPDARERKSESTIEVVLSVSRASQLAASVRKLGARESCLVRCEWPLIVIVGGGAGDFTRLLFGVVRGLLAKPSRTQAEGTTVVPPVGVVLVYS